MSKAGADGIDIGGELEERGEGDEGEEVVGLDRADIEQSGHHTQKHCYIEKRKEERQIDAYNKRIDRKT